MEFRVDGDPLPQGSHTAIRVGNRCIIRDQQNLTRRDGAGNITRKSDALERWREKIATAAVESFGPELLTVPVLLGCRFSFVRPSTHYRKDGELNALGRRNPHPRKFDLSKLVRAVEDSLTGNAYRDDIDVVGYLPGTGKKWGDTAGVDVVVRLAT